MSEKTSFVEPLARRYFPNSSSEAVTKAVSEGGRTMQIKEEIRAVSGFPENLVEPTANLVGFLEIATDRTIKPYDGGAIGWLDMTSGEAIKKLGESVRRGGNVAVITPDRMVGRFNFGEETVVVDYKSGQEKPEVVSCNGAGRNGEASEQMIKRISEIDNPQVSVVEV